MLFLAEAMSCAGITAADSSDNDSTTKTETWAFVADDGKSPLQTAKVTIHGCTGSRCIGAAMTGASPTWKNQFGSCSLPWNISGNMSGDLVSFTVNGSACLSLIQGRADGKANGKFGTATSASGTLTYDGWTDAVGRTRVYNNGTLKWTARKVCDTDCSF
jgi:hypothetical protein